MAMGWDTIRYSLWEGVKKQQEKLDADKKQSDAETMDALRKMAKQMDDARKAVQAQEDAQRAIAFKWVYHGGKYVASFQAYYDWHAMGNIHHCPKCKIPIPGDVSYSSNWQRDMASNRNMMVHARCGAQMVLE